MKKLVTSVVVAAIVILAAQAAYYKHQKRQAGAALSAVERQALRDAPNSNKALAELNGQASSPSGALGQLRGQAPATENAPASVPVEHGVIATPAPAQIQNAVPDRSAFVVNDDGIKLNITGRAAEYYGAVRRMVKELEGRNLDLSETLGVMDDSYADVWAKLNAIETISRNRNIERHNVHLEGTLMWVDGVMRDRGRTIAINTCRVFFHHANNPRSEIDEGNRRVDQYLEEETEYFEENGRAEQALGRLDEVILAFDVRGYDEIKQHLKSREREISARYGNRFRFAYLDEIAKIPQTTEAMRNELNVLVDRYNGKGLEKIIDGVIYSRYVGLLLELKALEYFLNRGCTILQSGRDLFDSNGQYVTELDAVVRDPAGKVAVVEAKSARVPLPLAVVLHDKVLVKLDAYSKNRSLLEAAIGSKLDQVIFFFEVGENVPLEPYLKSKEEALSVYYGFPVRFVFLDSSP